MALFCANAKRAVVRVGLGHKNPFLGIFAGIVRRRALADPTPGLGRAWGKIGGRSGFSRVFFPGFGENRPNWPIFAVE